MRLLRALFVLLVALAVCAPPRLAAMASADGHANAGYTDLLIHAAHGETDCHSDAPPKPVKAHLSHLMCVAACACLPAPQASLAGGIDAVASRLPASPDDRAQPRFAPDGPFRPPKSQGENS